MNANAETELKRYVEQVTQIRELSSPQIGDVDGADSYRLRLLENYEKIAEIAKDNERILQEQLYPAIFQGEKLKKEGIKTLRDFSETLFDAYSLDNMDSPLVFYVARRLMLEADMLNDDEARIIALDQVVTSSYLMICTTERLLPTCEICLKYYRIGLRAAERLLTYLEHDKFLSFSPELRKIIIVNARYIRVVSEIDELPLDKESRDLLLTRMKAALALAEDPFYREHLPDYDWKLHLLRTYEYIVSLSDFNNERGYDEESLQFINECAKKMAALLETDDDELRAKHFTVTYQLSLARNAYLAGEIDLETYKSKLEDLIYWDFREEGAGEVPVVMLQAPLEYMLVLDRSRLTAREKSCLNHFYHNLITYMHQTPKKDMLTFHLSMISMVLKNFIEVPGGMDMETLAMSLMAVLNPMTYVHSLGVADLTRTFTHHLLLYRPGLFVGMPGYPDEETVKAHRAEIEDYAYHAGLCHDIGKILIVETLLTYGRRLLEDELEFVRAHPAAGADLLTRADSMEAYADASHGHHRWYNHQGGYPDSYAVEDSPYKAIVDCIECADSLDAATDTVGRSYKAGKTVEAFLGELDYGSGTRYAPYLAELLKKEEVQADIETFLSKGRDENYRKLYFLLKKYQTPGEAGIR